MTKSAPIPFQTINWNSIAKSTHPGQTGSTVWQTLQWPGLRLRIVEYSAGYLADHWCTRGHIVHCLSGECISELHTGDSFTLSTGMTYIVSDEQSTYRSHTATGVKLLIIDGEFLHLP
jgi:hypothetical protein